MLQTGDGKLRDAWDFFESVLESYPTLKAQLDHHARFAQNLFFESGILVVQDGMKSGLCPAERLVLSALRQNNAEGDLDSITGSTVMERALKRLRSIDHETPLEFLTLCFCCQLRISARDCSRSLDAASKSVASAS